MATEMLSPDQIISHSGFSGAPSEVLINGTWITAADNNTDITLDAGWPLPLASLTIGANLQSINVIARKSASSGTGTPTLTIEVWETGGGASLASLSPQNITSTTGQTVTITFDAAMLSNVSGADLEIRVQGLKSGGSPAKRSSVDIDGLEWAADYQTTSSHNLTSDQIHTPVAALATYGITQQHIIDLSSIATGNISLLSVSLSQEDLLLSGDLETAAPSLNTVSLDSSALLNATAMTAGSALVSDADISQSQGLTASAPVLTLAAISQLHADEGASILISPTMGSSSFSQNHQGITITLIGAQPIVSGAALRASVVASGHPDRTQRLVGGFTGAPVSGHRTNITRSDPNDQLNSDGKAVAPNCHRLFNP